MKKQFLEIGTITSTHGVKGEVKVYPWCDAPEFLCEIDDIFFDDMGKEVVAVESARVQKNLVIMKLKDINDMNTAENMKNKILYVNRNEFILEEDTYFIQDLIGLKVYNADDEIYYGEITEITQVGGNDVYHIKNEDKLILIPAIADVVILTDIENNIMKIRPLKGLL